MSKTSKQQHAADKYLKEKVDTFVVRVKVGHKLQLQTHARDRGESLNGFINRAISETVERDSREVAPEKVEKES